MPEVKSVFDSGDGAKLQIAFACVVELNTAGESDRIRMGFLECNGDTSSATVDRESSHATGQVQAEYFDSLNVIDEQDFRA